MHYRYILIVALLCLAFGQARPQQETPPQNKRDEAHGSAPVVPTQPPAHQEQGATKDTPKKCPLPPWTDPFWPNWLLVIVTGFAVWVGFGTLSDLKEQTATAKASAEEAKQAAIFSRKATMESERADILLDAASIVPSVASGIIDGDASLKFRYKNFGRTRAKDVRIKVWFEIKDVNLTGAVVELPPMVMGSGQEQTVALQTFRECLTERTFNQITQGKLELIFIAFAVYEDVFGGIHTARDAGVFDSRSMRFRVIDKMAE